MTLFDIKINPETKAEKTERPDILSILGRKKLNLSDEWSRYAWKRYDPDRLRLTLGITRFISKGKNKGRKTWDGKIEVFVTDAEIEATELEWENETGKCHNCGGDGSEWAGSSYETGFPVHSYRKCERCEGSGIAPKAE